MSRDYEYLRVSGTRIEVFWVYETERRFFRSAWPLYARPSMAAHLPYLPGSPSAYRRVPTSFVPPAHNQGVSLAPQQGLAPWKIFLPTTGSFFVIC